MVTVTNYSHCVIQYILVPFFYQIMIFYLLTCTSKVYSSHSHLKQWYAPSSTPFYPEKTFLFHMNEIRESLSFSVSSLFSLTWWLFNMYVCMYVCVHVYVLIRVCVCLHYWSLNGHLDWFHVLALMKWCWINTKYILN